MSHTINLQLQNDITEMFGFSDEIEKRGGHKDMKW